MNKADGWMGMEIDVLRAGVLVIRFCFGLARVKGNLHKCYRI